MKYSRWKDAVELVGIASIIASLVFVGFQLKHTNEIALAGRYQARTESTMAHLDAMIQSEAMVRAFSKRGPERSAAENSLICIHQGWLVMAYDNSHYQHEMGFLDDDAFSAFTKRFVDQTLHHGCEEVENNRNFFRASFERHVDELAAAHPIIPTSLKRPSE